ncbi:hypothetical protein KDA_69990 [Dictyobacter alpinus]|uniref:Aminoglycoside phosphotransferase domain-containing protein n=1 Tax=Dictyobacter alpinus TaxID=2014873 RepID=A0A402BJJ5_9CHLR|nr:aminoglycoside phosphotransferase family protein [Dictyobacter alpinus]GCE31515.1 hypothetical protein KDA_69990 [Dictyobacter alpinus]
MADHQATIATDEIQSLLASYFSGEITDLVELTGGRISRTYAFHVGEQAYIIRFNKDNMLNTNLPKEAYLSQRLASSRIPIPPIFYTGRLGELYYAISQKMPGKMLDQLSPQEVEELLPEVIELLDTIHQVDVSTTTGYGIFDYQGQGMAASWRDSLLQVGQEEDTRDFFGKWYHLFEDSFLERDLYQELYRKMRQLLDVCPTERYLLHGSPSFRNILAEQGRVSAVLDWVDARYGDFVYDIAYLDIWTPEFRIAERFQEYYQQRQQEVTHYQERLLCYYYYIALGALRFYAYSNEAGAYQWMRQVILAKHSLA